MTEQTKARIGEKLRKLLRLTHSPNMHEARLARDRYTKLSATSGVTIDEREVTQGEMAFITDHYDLRHNLAGSIIIEHFGVNVLVSQRIPRLPRRIWIVGDPAALSPAKDLFDQLILAMDRGWDWFQPLAVVSNKNRHEFRWGVFNAISLRLTDLRAETAARAAAATPRLSHAGRTAHPAPDEPSAQPVQEEGDTALAVVESEPKDERQAYLDEKFPSLEKREASKAPAKTESFLYGCRYGFGLKIGDLEPVPGMI